MTQNTQHLIKEVNGLIKRTTIINATFVLGASIFLTSNLPEKRVEAAQISESRYIELEKKEMLRKYYVQTKISSEIVVKPKPKPQPVFQPQYGDYTTYDLSKPSNLTAKQIDAIVAGTNLQGLGWAYVQAEKQYGVNALYLLSHSALESGWGSSSIANAKNNLFGFKAYDSSPGRSAGTFKTKADCILVVASYISKHYFNPNGDYYNGRTLRGMNKKYASDQSWAYKISDIMKDIQERVEV